MSYRSKFGAATIAALSFAAVPHGAQATEFILRIYNAGTENGMTYADGTKESAALSWGVWALHEGPSPLFAPGQPAGREGLENLAEDGNPFIFDKSLPRRSDVKAYGVLKARPVDGLATIFPGMLFRALVDAEPGDRLSFAVMFEQTNDAFYAFGPEGVALFDDAGQPVSADLTGQVMLWDAGTEMNQPLGNGVDNGVNQSGPNVGPDENGVVHAAEGDAAYPPVASVIRVTIEPR
ncbi:MAG: hypothetical protein CMM50_02450 [Rhodospirillaceae bacterium]|nr:hypothetical protein [Rhodospirillaceae bacterium]